MKMLVLGRGLVWHISIMLNLVKRGKRQKPDDILEWIAAGGKCGSKAKL